MKKIAVLFFILVNLCLSGHGQQFTSKFSFALSDTLDYDGIEWMDADNDGFLDVVVYGTNPAGTETISFFRNSQDAPSGFNFVHHIDTEISNAAFLLADYDGDNRIDIIVSGLKNGHPVTIALLNKGSFLFQGTPILNMSGEVIRLADFDGDAAREIMLSERNSGEASLRILKHSDSGWVIVHDSIKVEAKDIEVFDFDADNDLDFFVAGLDEMGKPVNRFFYNEESFFFAQRDFADPVLGSTAMTDLNHDGNFDIVVAGMDERNTQQLRTFVSTSTGFTVRDSLLAVSDPEIFAADFNSDGRYDLSIFGNTASGDTINTITGIHYLDTLPHSGLRVQRFGDFERDGNLDLLHLIETPSAYSFALFENRTPVTNGPPGPPTNAVTFYLFNRLFIGWEKPVDDLTVTASLTYAVSLRTADGDITAGEFDLASARMLHVQHGNTGTAHYRLIKVTEEGPFDFTIVAVDNAFHTGSGSKCEGTGGGPDNCGGQFTVTHVEACQNELITLPSEEFAEWYSFEEGFLAASDSLSLTIQASDTIFSVTRTAPGCVEVQVYIIDAPANLVKSTESTQYVCAGDTLFMQTEPGWAEREWTSAVHGFLGADDAIEYLVTGPDTVVMVASDGMGCEITRKTALQISKPVIDVADEGFQIMKGGSVQLNASGGVDYQWSPASGLSDPQSSGPVASPVETTKYTVTVKDSIGCFATRTIIVMVEGTAFIPDLFTPNHDGTNDVIKIYALGEVRDFSFSIYNREGSRVYSTNNAAEMSTRGWDGTTSGVEQPAGIYHWNVNGQTVNGLKLQLNGKNSGAIVLVR